MFPEHSKFILDQEVKKMTKIVISEIKSDVGLRDISELERVNVLGGRLPNETEITVILALDQKNPPIAKQYTGDLLADRPTAVNIAVILGNNNNVGQVVQ